MRHNYCFERKLVEIQIPDAQTPRPLRTVVPYFFIATAIMPVATGGHSIMTRYFREEAEEALLPSRFDAYQSFQGDSGASLTFFYYERDELPAGSYLVCLTAQSPQEPYGGYQVRSTAEVKNFSRKYPISQLFQETRHEKGVGLDWTITFWQVSPVNL